MQTCGSPDAVKSSLMISGYKEGESRKRVHLHNEVCTHPKESTLQQIPASPLSPSIRPQECATIDGSGGAEVSMSPRRHSTTASMLPECCVDEPPFSNVVPPRATLTAAVGRSSIDDPKMIKGNEGSLLKERTPILEEMLARMNAASGSTTNASVSNRRGLAETQGAVASSLMHLEVHRRLPMTHSGKMQTPGLSSPTVPPSLLTEPLTPSERNGVGTVTICRDSTGCHGHRNDEVLRQLQHIGDEQPNAVENDRPYGEPVQLLAGAISGTEALLEQRKWGHPQDVAPMHQQLLQREREISRCRRDHAALSVALAASQREQQRLAARLTQAEADVEGCTSRAHREQMVLEERDREIYVLRSQVERWAKKCESLSEQQVHLEGEKLRLEAQLSVMLRRGGCDVGVQTSTDVRGIREAGWQLTSSQADTTCDTSINSSEDALFAKVDLARMESRLSQEILQRQRAEEDVLRLQQQCQNGCREIALLTDRVRTLERECALRTQAWDDHQHRQNDLEAECERLRDVETRQLDAMKEDRDSHHRFLGLLGDNLRMLMDACGAPLTPHTRAPDRKNGAAVPEDVSEEQIVNQIGHIRDALRDSIAQMRADVQQLQAERDQLSSTCHRLQELELVTRERLSMAHESQATHRDSLEEAQQKQKSVRERLAKLAPVLQKQRTLLRHALREYKPRSRRPFTGLENSQLTLVCKEGSEAELNEFSFHTSGLDEDDIFVHSGYEEDERTKRVGDRRCTVLETVERLASDGQRDLLQLLDLWRDLRHLHSRTQQRLKEEVSVAGSNLAAEKQRYASLEERYAASFRASRTAAQKRVEDVAAVQAKMEMANQKAEARAEKAERALALSEKMSVALQRRVKAAENATKAMEMKSAEHMTALNVAQHEAEAAQKLLRGAMENVATLQSKYDELRGHSLTLNADIHQARHHADTMHFMLRSWAQLLVVVLCRYEVLLQEHQAQKRISAGAMQTVDYVAKIISRTRFTDDGLLSYDGVPEARAASPMCWEANGYGLMKVKSSAVANSQRVDAGRHSSRLRAVFRAVLACCRLRQCAQWRVRLLRRNISSGSLNTSCTSRRVTFSDDAVKSSGGEGSGHWRSTGMPLDELFPRALACVDSSGSEPHLVIPTVYLPSSTEMVEVLHTSHVPGDDTATPAKCLAAQHRDAWSLLRHTVYLDPSVEANAFYLSLLSRQRAYVPSGKTLQMHPSAHSVAHILETVLLVLQEEQTALRRCRQERETQLSILLEQNKDLGEALGLREEAQQEIEALVCALENDLNRRPTVQEVEGLRQQLQQAQDNWLKERQARREAEEKVSQHHTREMQLLAQQKELQTEVRSLTIELQECSRINLSVDDSSHRRRELKKPREHNVRSASLSSVTTPSSVAVSSAHSTLAPHPSTAPPGLGGPDVGNHAVFSAHLSRSKHSSIGRPGDTRVPSRSEEHASHNPGTANIVSTSQMGLTDLHESTVKRAHPTQRSLPSVSSCTPTGSVMHSSTRTGSSRIFDAGNRINMSSTVQGEGWDNNRTDTLIDEGGSFSQCLSREAIMQLSEQDTQAELRRLLQEAEAKYILLLGVLSFWSCRFTHPTRVVPLFLHVHPRIEKTYLRFPNGSRVSLLLTGNSAGCPSAMDPKSLYSDTRASHTVTSSHQHTCDYKAPCAALTLRCCQCRCNYSAYSGETLLCEQALWSPSLDPEGRRSSPRPTTSVQSPVSPASLVQYISCSKKSFIPFAGRLQAPWTPEDRLAMRTTLSTDGDVMLFERRRAEPPILKPASSDVRSEGALNAGTWNRDNLPATPKTATSVYRSHPAIVGSLMTTSERYRALQPSVLSPWRNVRYDSLNLACSKPLSETTRESSDRPHMTTCNHVGEPLELRRSLSASAEGCTSKEAKEWYSQLPCVTPNTPLCTRFPALFVFPFNWCSSRARKKFAQDAWSVMLIGTPCVSPQSVGGDAGPSTAQSYSHRTGPATDLASVCDGIHGVLCSAFGLDPSRPCSAEEHSNFGRSATNAHVQTTREASHPHHTRTCLPAVVTADMCAYLRQWQANLLAVASGTHCNETEGGNCLTKGHSLAQRVESFTLNDMANTLANLQHNSTATCDVSTAAARSPLLPQAVTTCSSSALSCTTTECVHGTKRGERCPMCTDPVESYRHLSDTVDKLSPADSLGEAPSYKPKRHRLMSREELVSQFHRRLLQQVMGYSLPIDVPLCLTCWLTHLLPQLQRAAEQAVEDAAGFAACKASSSLHLVECWSPQEVLFTPFMAQARVQSSLRDELKGVFSSLCSTEGTSNCCDANAKDTLVLPGIDDTSDITCLRQLECAETELRSLNTRLDDMRAVLEVLDRESSRNAARWQILAKDENAAQVVGTFEHTEEVRARACSMRRLLCSLDIAQSYSVLSMLFPINVSGPIGTIAGLRLGLAEPYKGTEGSMGVGQHLSQTKDYDCRAFASGALVSSAHVSFLDDKAVPFSSPSTSLEARAAEDFLWRQAEYTRLSLGNDKQPGHVPLTELNAACGYLLELLQHMADIHEYEFRTAILHPAGERSTVDIVEPRTRGATRSGSHSGQRRKPPVVSQTVNFFCTTRIFGWRTFDIACETVAICVRELCNFMRSGLHMVHNLLSIPQRAEARSRGLPLRNHFCEDEFRPSFPLALSQLTAASTDGDAKSMAVSTAYVSDGQDSGAPEKPVACSPDCIITENNCEPANVAACTAAEDGMPYDFPDPPFLITSRGMIDGFSVKHGHVSDELWTIGMKRLLANVQWCVKAATELQRWVHLMEKV